MLGVGRLGPRREPAIGGTLFHSVSALSGRMAGPKIAASPPQAVSEDLTSATRKFSLDPLHIGASAVGGFNTSLSQDTGSAAKGSSALGARQARRCTPATREGSFALTPIVRWLTGL